VTETAEKWPVEIKGYHGHRRKGKLPAKSKQQWNKMFALYKRGEITKEELDRFVKGVDYDSLPERVAKKRSKRGKRRR